MNTAISKRIKGLDAARHGGQAMTEFILVFVFVFLVFVGAIQIILFMYAYNTLADAAKEGVRYAIVHGTENTQCSGPGNPNASPVVTCPDKSPYANVQTAVIDFAALSFQGITTSDVTVSYNPKDQNGTCANNSDCSNSGCSAPGCIVRVTITHAYKPLFGFNWPKFTLYAAADGRIIN